MKNFLSLIMMVVLILIGAGCVHAQTSVTITVDKNHGRFTAGNASGSWSSVWTSNDDVLKFSASANNMCWASSDANHIDARCGTSGSSTYTLAPVMADDYVITGYSLKFHSLGNKTQAWTINGTTYTSSSTIDARTINVTGLNVRSVEFTESQNNDTGTLLYDFTVTLKYSPREVKYNRYKGVQVTTGDQMTYYLFEQQPTVKFKDVEGVKTACFYIAENVSPVVSVPFLGGAKMTVCYNVWTTVNLNSAGYATFSCKDASYIATDGVTAYKASVSGETITLTALEGNIPAGTGVMLYGEEAGAEVVLPVATCGSAANMTGNVLNATTLMDGSLAPFKANAWALGDGSLFLRYTGDAFIHNRAYLVHIQETEAKSMRMVFTDDEQTGLDNIVSTASAKGGKYLEKGNIVIIKDSRKYNVLGQPIK